MRLVIATVLAQCVYQAAPDPSQALAGHDPRHCNAGSSNTNCGIGEEEWELMAPGQDICTTITQHCSANTKPAGNNIGDGSNDRGSSGAAQQCMKQTVEGLLGSAKLLGGARRQMVASTDLYFLCTASYQRVAAVLAQEEDGDVEEDSVDGGRREESEWADEHDQNYLESETAQTGSETRRVQALNRMLLHASAAMGLSGNDAELDEYRAAARWSELAEWTHLEKLSHFVTALQHIQRETTQDNMHCIDRIAVTLGESADAAKAQLRSLRQKLPLSPSDQYAADITSPTQQQQQQQLPQQHARMARRMAKVQQKIQTLLHARQLVLHYAVLRKLIQHPLQRPLAPVDAGLYAQPVWRNGPPQTAEQASSDQAVFPWVTHLEDPEMFQLLQSELLSQQQHQPVGTGDEVQSEGIHSGVWTERHLITQGFAEPTAKVMYPKTMRLLAELEVETGVHFINVRLSSLQSGTHISTHCGLSSLKLRAHLGLRVPNSGRSSTNPHRSRIRVGQQLAKWREGHVLIFDDSFEHEVWWQWNDSSDAHTDPSNSRVILILDVFHPQLSAQKIESIKASWTEKEIQPLL